MGSRFYQSIKTCYNCGETPEDGAAMWYMDGNPWCEDCANNKYWNTDNPPQGEAGEQG